MLPHIVQTRAMTIGRAPQADLPRQGIERSMNLAAIQSIAPTGEE